MKKFSTYGFSGINIKKDIAKRFRAFSKDISKSHSETLEAMLNFFKWNNLDPNDNLIVKTDATKKRINALIAIVRNIKKQQTLPTKAMLDTLFQEINKVDKEEKEVERFDFGTPETLSQDTELEHYKKRYDQMQQELSTYRNNTKNLLKHLTYVKGTFGKGYYKLDMKKDELEKLQKELNNVHHHHCSESTG
ncbi:BfmA/BtgA family mobilization protein [Zunongwangia sp.]|uniref:BfmA/BtgA family mobilization protein n=1 Tax=Zunongwangia sp. TaxID=1965325 RepID=UPI003AA96E9F